jgi:hypothetical protein
MGALSSEIVNLRIFGKTFCEKAVSFFYVLNIC